MSQGKQEDAEEFLGSILDGLHEEIVNAKKAATPPKEDDGSSVGEGIMNFSVFVCAQCVQCSVCVSLCMCLFVYLCECIY